MTPILETIFSLLFVLLVFSLITSWIVEYITMRVQKRSKMLRQYILWALNDKFNKNWGLLLYGHPLIEVLHHEIKLAKGFRKLFHNNQLHVKRRLPAYIPSDQFAAALIDLIIHHNQESVFKQSEVTGKQELVLSPITNKTMDDFISSLDMLKESEVKITLAALARKIGGTADAMQQLHFNIAEWYDNGMERLNGWYKRTIRIWLFAVGLIVAICFNVNTITVVNRLYQDPQLRSSVTQAADKFLTDNKELPSSPQSIDSLANKIDSLRNTLAPLNLPIGWKIKEDFAQRRREDSLAKNESFFEGVGRRIGRATRLIGAELSLQNLIGWLLTAFAISFGAPFWFDVLKKFANVRSVGLRPTIRSANNDPDKR